MMLKEIATARVVCALTIHLSRHASAAWHAAKNSQELNCFLHFSSSNYLHLLEINLILIKKLAQHAGLLSRSRRLVLIIPILAYRL